MLPLCSPGTFVGIPKLDETRPKVQPDFIADTPHRENAGTPVDTGRNQRRQLAVCMSNHVGKAKKLGAEHHITVPIDVSG
jgi:hypothetical protein